MKRFLSIVGSVLTAAVILCGCDANVENEYQYIRLDVANVSFAAEKNSPVEISVTAPGTWTVEPSASWIKIDDQTDNSVTVSVEDNDTEDERIGTLTFTMGAAVEEVTVNQLPKVGTDYIYRYPVQFDLGAVMSPNGKYVGGQIPILNDDETWTHQIIIIDVDADEQNIVAEVPASLFGIEKPYCISDTGLFFIMNNQGGTVAYDLDGNYMVPTAPADCLPGVDIQCVSSDGRIYAGMAYRASDSFYLPMKWVDGVPEVLPMPEKNYRDSVWVTGIIPRGMSEDGSVIYGSSWDNNDFGMCYWDKNGDFHWVGEDARELDFAVNDYGFGEVTENIVNGMTCTAELTNMSPNGRWIAGTWRKEITAPGVGQPGGGSTCAAFYDTENHKTYIFEGEGSGGTTCTNDGLGFTTNGLGANGGNVIDIENGVVLGSVSEWIQDTYGITPGPGFIVQLSPDKSRILSMCLAADAAVGMRTTHWFIAPAPER